MNDLIDQVISAAGGLERYRSFRKVSATLGIRMPTRFRIFPRSAANLAVPAPLIVGVNVSDFRFT